MMWELIQANKRKSIIIFIGMGVLLILIGFAFGSFYNPDSGGILGIFFALILFSILSMISYFAGSKILLAVSGAKEVTQDVHPQLFNVVEEMRIAANLPNTPKVYIMQILPQMLLQLELNLKILLLLLQPDYWEH